MRITHLFILYLFITLNSCDCIQRGKGVVIDSETKKPINDVLIRKYFSNEIDSLSKQEAHSDIRGNFEFTSISGGFRKCPDLILYFLKKGYCNSKVIFTCKSIMDTVYLEPINRNSFSAQSSLNTNMTNEKMKLRISLSEGDSILYKDFTISKPYRIVGYSQPDINSEKLILISSYTDDIDEVESKPRLGCYASIGDEEELRIKFNNIENDFVKATAIVKNEKSILVYFEKNQVLID